jgi:hypothetical protein
MRFCPQPRRVRSITSLTWTFHESKRLPHRWLASRLPTFVRSFRKLLLYVYSEKTCPYRVPRKPEANADMFPRVKTRFCVTDRLETLCASMP